MAVSQLVMCLGYAAGLVLCVGGDGHIALETLLGQVCCSHENESAPDRLESHHVLAEAACDCVDTPIVLPTREVQLSTRDLAALPLLAISEIVAVRAPVAAEALCLSRVECRARPPRELAALRSVILLV